MTSFILKEHEHRPTTPWATAPDCPFCRILRGEGSAFKLYEDDSVIAILDILPLRRGHALVIPKIHVSRVSELPEQFAARCGIAVSKLARALSEAYLSMIRALASPPSLSDVTLTHAKGLQNTGLNVVCNQEYAQAVPHVHYHIIPAPKPSDIGEAVQSDHVTVPLVEKEMHYRELEARGRLDDADAQRIVDIVTARL